MRTPPRAFPARQAVRHVPQKVAQRAMTALICRAASAFPVRPDARNARRVHRVRHVIRPKGTSWKIISVLRTVRQENFGNTNVRPVHARSAHGGIIPVRRVPHKVARLARTALICQRASARLVRPDARHARRVRLVQRAIPPTVTNWRMASAKKRALRDNMWTEIHVKIV